MPYIVSLKQFDGPLDLLLTLISNAKIAIQDIFVSQITEQYLETMSLVDELDMDSASEFLQMAATLLEIKSRSMLPKPPKPEDPDELSPEEALIKQLEEYRQFKQLIERLNRTYKFHTRPRNGFKDLDGATALTTLFVAYYNHLRPHSALKGAVPVPLAELDGIDTFPMQWEKLVELATA